MKNTLGLSLLFVAALACHERSTGHGGIAGASAGSLSGQVTFGPLHGGTIQVFALNANGTDGALLASGSTDSQGNFSIPLKHSGPVRVAVSGGNYVSEMDGTVIDLGPCSFSYILDNASGGASGLSLSPIADLIHSLAAAGAASSGNIVASHASAKALLAAFYGITGDVERILPNFDASAIGTEEFKLSFVLGAFEALAKSLSPSDRCALLRALAHDIADGLFDGRENGVPVPLGSGNLPSTAGTSDFLSRLNDYANNGQSNTDQGIDPNTLLGTINEIKGGVANSSATPPATGLAPGSSGAISTMAFGGKQWVFIAARTQGVVAIDVTDPTAVAPEIKVWNTLYSVTFNNKEVGGVVPLAGADHPQLLVFAYVSKHIAIINADTGVVEYEGDLPLAALSPISFSGGSAFIAGGIPDTGRDGVWLATADGYVFFNRATKTLGTNYAVDCPHMLAENLGGDVGHGLLWCPNYRDDCGPGDGGVQLVDLNAGKSYYMDDTAYNTYFRSQGLDYCDAGAVDSGLQVGIITNEDSPNVGFVNLATISKTDNVMPTLSTFTPAVSGGAKHMNLTESDYIEISGSAVDSSSHLALFMAGYSTEIAVGQLQDPNSLVDPSTWQGLSDWRYYTIPSYQYARDPHAVAAVTNLTNGKVYGYLLDGSNHKALQLDMAAMLATTPAGAVGDLLHQITSDLFAANVIVNRTW